MLADDRVDIPRGRRAGEAHPHAGFEIVTFAVEGEARDRDEGLLRAGDVLWMTAASPSGGQDAAGQPAEPRSRHTSEAGSNPFLMRLSERQKETTL